uniref:Uncharacterized protein n=1 Tax=Oryza glumipatula TaxID=40148 RepID=A0A0E0BPD4_9ORYZ
METMSYPCSLLIPFSTQFEEISSSSLLLWSPQAEENPHENANMYEFDADHSHDQIHQDHQFLDMMVIQESANEFDGNHSHDQIHQDHEFLETMVIQESANEFDGDHSHDQIHQDHEFLEMMAIQESANDLLQLQDDFSVPNADPLAASFEFDERLAVAGHENGNVVAAQEESAGDLLLAGAMAVDAGDAVHASAIMSRLDDLLADIAGRRSCEATSPVDHLAYYFARGLKLRISGAATPASSPPPPAANWSSPAYRMLQELTPFVKFAHFTANQAILEATADDLDVHVIDFNVGEGVQWSSLMSDLAAAGRHRSSKPPLFHLTDVITSGAGTPRTADARRWLSEFAESLHLPFRYTSLHVHDGDDDDELHHELAMICNGSSSPPVILTCDDTTTTTNTPLRSRLKLILLGTITILQPKLVILIEDELSRISKNPPSPSLAAPPPFPEFFSDAVAHFTAVMESTASCLVSYDDEAWLSLRRVGEEVVGPRVEDAVGRYGSLAGGAQMMEGLRAREVSGFSVAQGKMLAGLFGGGFGVVHQEKGRLALCWKSRPLISVSLWCPK